MKSNEWTQDEEKKLSMERIIEAERAYLAARKRREMSKPLSDGEDMMDRTYEVMRDNALAVERRSRYFTPDTFDEDHD